VICNDEDTDGDCMVSSFDADFATLFSSVQSEEKSVEGGVTPRDWTARVQVAPVDIARPDNLKKMSLEPCSKLTVTDGRGAKLMKRQ